MSQCSEMCETHSKEAVDAFMDWGCEELDNFEGCYLGEDDSEEDHAEQFAGEVYDLDRQMGRLSSYFDYARFIPVRSSASQCPATCSWTTTTTTTA